MKASNPIIRVLAIGPDNQKIDIVADEIEIDRSPVVSHYGFVDVRNACVQDATGRMALLAQIPTTWALTFYRA